MQKFPLLILLILFAIAGKSQPHHHTYKLNLDDSLQILKGKVEISFVNNSGNELQEIFIHLPPRSLEWKGSFLHKQFVEFQDVDLFYAKKEKRGYIKIEKLPFSMPSLEDDAEKKEFLRLALPEELIGKEKVDFELHFEIGIADAAFTGTGYDGQIYRLINWLPRVAMLDSSGWQLNPVTYQNDLYQNFDSFNISLNLDNSFVIATNGIINTQSERENYQAMAKEPFYQVPVENGKKIVEISFNSTTSPQLFISKAFFIFRVNDSVRLFYTRKDPYFPYTIAEIDKNVNSFLSSQIGDGFDRSYDVVLLDKKTGEYQSDNLISLEYPKDIFALSTEIIHARAQQILRYGISNDGFKQVWLARGLPYYYKYQYINIYYPDKKWLPFSNSFIGRFFDLDEFNYDYQNQFLYLYLARQGLDQPMSTPADSLSKLNYEAIAQAKSYLGFTHLYAYMGERDFKRGIRKYIQDNKSKRAGSSKLKNSLKYYHFNDLDWFFNELVNSSRYNDYAVQDFDHCPTVTTVTVKNKGKMIIPYSISGIKDGKIVETDWFAGHEDTKVVQLYHAEYDRVVINHHQTAPEFSQRNNRYKTKGFFKKTEPLRFQLWNGFENPEKSQIFWMPTASYNAYDKVLAGISLYNQSLVNKPFEYVIGPEYSFGTGKLTGYGSALFNITPSGTPFHRISAGLFVRYRHYDQDLAFFRASPSVSFYFKRKYGESSILQKLRFRGVSLQRELPSEFDGKPNSLTNASYTVFTANYLLEDINILRPLTLNVDFQYGDQFSKISVVGDFRWMLPNKRWLIWRNFAGVFLNNSFSDQGLNGNYYSYGLSGTQDYLFDYSFIGRSDSSGIWSKQFFVTDGGFKTETGVLSDRYMVTSGLSIPIWTAFGVFGDVGIVDNTDRLYWDYGVRIAVFTDFLEFYLPFQNQDKYFLSEPAYYENIRFVLNVDIGEIIGRIRRGYY